MGWRGFLHIALLTLVAGGVLLFWLTPKDPFNLAEQSLFDGIDHIASQRASAPRDFVEAFDLPDACRSGNCYLEKSPVPALGGSTMHLRQGEDGLIFTIENLDRVCIRTDRALVKYRGGKIEDNCMDASCPSYNIRRDWGLLGFYQPARGSNCIRSIVVNSERWFRE